jgi:hypothetical protein
MNKKVTKWAEEMSVVLPLDGSDEKSGDGGGGGSGGLQPDKEKGKTQKDKQHIQSRQQTEANKLRQSPKPVMTQTVQKATRLVIEVEEDEENEDGDEGVEGQKNFSATVSTTTASSGRVVDSDEEVGGKDKEDMTVTAGMQTTEEQRERQQEQQHGQRQLEQEYKQMQERQLCHEHNERSEHLRLFKLRSRSFDKDDDEGDGVGVTVTVAIRGTLVMVLQLLVAQITGWVSI